MTQFSRREFLALVAGAVAAPLLPACAGSARRLAVSDPEARTLDYVANAAQTPPATADFVPGSACANCALYQRRWEDNGYAPCPTFADRTVPRTGWCRAYTRLS